MGGLERRVNSAFTAKLTALLTARFETDTCLTANVVDTACVGRVGCAVVDTTSGVTHLECHLPEMARFELVQDVLTAEATPTHEVVGLDENGPRTLETTRATRQAIELRSVVFG